MTRRPRTSKPSPGRSPDALARENARLREQQAATADILRLIAGSPADTRPVFDGIVRRAARLCDAAIAAVFLTDGRLLHHPANFGADPEALARIRAQFPRPLDDTSTPGRAILTRAVVHVPDVDAPAAPATLATTARTVGFRSVVTVPMLRDGDAVGALTVARRQPGPFEEDEIALLQTFADQAVIAIENARLFTEREARNRALSEALDQQTATAEILRVVSGSPTDLRPVFDSLLEHAGRLCRAESGILWLYDGEAFRATALRGVPDPYAAVVSGPVRPSPATGLGRVATERRPVHIEDVAAESLYAEREPLRVATVEILRARTFLAVPLLKDGALVGTFVLYRQRVEPFTDRQIALVQTFADQAVIAIENVRLFTELQEKNRRMTEALEQQMATAEILRVISISPTDVQPVYDAIVESAVRLCGGLFSTVALAADDVMTLGALHGFVGASRERVERAFPAPLDGPLPSARVIRECQVVHLPDTEASSYAWWALPLGFRSYVSVPMLREGRALGAIAVARRDAGPFSEQQIALLQTFAAQAGIAIQNVQLFTELQARNRDLTEALERQTATAEILRVISGSPTSVQPVFDAIVESAGRLCGAESVAIYRFEDGMADFVAGFNFTAEQLAICRRRFPRALAETDQLQRVVDGSVLNIPDIQQDPHTSTARAADYRARSVHGTLFVPMLREGRAIGAIGVSRHDRAAFPDERVALLKTFADQAVIAIENGRLFTELQARNRALTEALDQQTATAEILRVISSSPTDLRPVLDTVARAAARFCGAENAAIARLDGDILRVMAGVGPFAEQARRRTGGLEGLAVPLTRGSVLGRAVVDGRTVHVADLAAEPEEEYPLGRRLQRQFDHRTMVATPLLREGVRLGAIMLFNLEVRPFSDKQLALLQTFADQAAIAVENVRLFTELQARTRELTRTVGQLRTLTEVGQALTSTLNLETLLGTIVSRAGQLAGTDTCSVYEYEERDEVFHLRATHNLGDEVAALARARPIRKGEGVAGLVAITHEPVEIPDIAVEGAYQGPLREALLGSGARALLAIPLAVQDRGRPAGLLGGQLIGGLTVTRKTPGRFEPETVELLRTFATQSALAIQNARLFQEIEDKGRQLEVASRHKSQFLANMSHELRTPLNAILGYTELILDAVYGEPPPRMREVLERIEKAGRHLLGLINDVLDLSKIEAGQLALAVEDYSIRDVVLGVASAAEALATEKGLELAVAVPDDPPPARGDARRLTQVLLNIVGNAIKFTDHGRVAVAAVTGAQGIQVSVADTGPGIAPGDLERIFEEFQQADTVTTRAKGGTGLGLAIARRIVELHGGRLWVESVVGEGSTFRFTLPWAPAAATGEEARP